MALNMPTFYKRTGSAIVFGIIMLGALLWPNDIGFFALTCVINFLCLREFFRLIAKIEGIARWPLWIAALIQGISLLLLLAMGLPIKSVVGIPWKVLGFFPLITPVALMAATLFHKNNLKPLLMGAGGLFYISMPMMQLMLLRERDMLLPIALIVMIWINDTMAYIVGSFIGKTPFSPISPKKTWEGTGGGAVLTIIAAVIYGWASGTYRLLDWAALSALVAVAGTLGDLFESKLKRTADVKDSGMMMPGHGGALDRFDSLLLATPVVYLYVQLFM